MSSNLKLGILSFIFLAVSCATPPPRELSPVEQIAVDTARAQGLASKFKGSVEFMKAPRIERFLARTASALVGASRDFPLGKVEVRIHRDQNPDEAYFFAFPGNLVSIPLSFLRTVEFENELAAAISYELAQVMDRHLASHVEAITEKGQAAQIEIFGSRSIFVMSPEERSQSIKRGSSVLYWAGYDVRGMTSIFQRYPAFFRNPGSETLKKEVEFNLREAQRARSELLPSLKPIVRSAEFIEFKKELERIR
jgi:predicted Zn-dependent protease